jgi:hypothetical protein
MPCNRIRRRSTSVILYLEPAMVSRHWTIHVPLRFSTQRVHRLRNHTPIPMPTSKLAAAQTRSAWRPGPRLGNVRCPRLLDRPSHASRPSITKCRKAFRTCLIRVERCWDQSCKLQREPRLTSNVGGNGIRRAFCLNATSASRLQTESVPDALSHLR